MSGPTPLIEYSGTGKATVVGLAAGPDGLYFTDLYVDQSFDTAVARGANILRIIYVPSTNLYAFSEQFDNASWSKNHCSVVANAATAPDGTLTADKLVEDSTNNQHSLQQYLVSPTNTVYTASVYIKAAERSFARVILYDGGSSYYGQYVDLTTGAAAGDAGPGGGAFATSWSISDAGNGWWRVSATGALPNSVGQIGLYVNASTGGGVSNYQGDGVSGIYVWGAQLERGLLSDYKAAPPH